MWLAQLAEIPTIVREVAGSKLRSDQHSRPLNNWRETAAFVMTYANGYKRSILFDDDKP